MNSIFSAGDVTLDGAVDLFTRRARDGVLFLYPGNGRGGPRIVGVGDWSGDRSADLLARRKDGSLWLYTGDGWGPFHPARCRS